MNNHKPINPNESLYFSPDRYTLCALYSYPNTHYSQFPSNPMRNVTGARIFQNRVCGYYTLEGWSDKGYTNYIVDDFGNLVELRI